MIRADIVLGRGETRCVFKRFWVDADSVKAALSRPTNQRVPTGRYANASRWVGNRALAYSIIT
jgi:hypothetical protein